MHGTCVHEPVQGGDGGGYLHDTTTTHTSTHKSNNRRELKRGGVYIQRGGVRGRVLRVTEIVWCSGCRCRYERHCEGMRVSGGRGE